MKNIILLLLIVSYAGCYGAADADKHDFIGVAGRESISYALKRGFLGNKYICTIASTFKTHGNKDQLQEIADRLFAKSKTKISKKAYIQNLDAEFNAFHQYDEKNMLTLTSIILQQHNSRSFLTCAVARMEKNADEPYGYYAPIEDPLCDPYTAFAIDSYSGKALNVPPIVESSVAKSDDLDQMATDLMTSKISEEFSLQFKDLMVVVDDPWSYEIVT